MRELVHEPTNTRSIRMSCIRVPGSRSMYWSARSSPSERGSGTASVTGTTMPGVVPQVTIGESPPASTTTSRSNSAPSSVCSSRQPSTAASRSSGAPGRGGWASNQANVVSSGATMPARPPPSIVMLHTVIRPSMESPSMAGPAYSTTWPTAPSTPIWPMVPRIRSLAVTPNPGSPS